MFLVCVRTVLSDTTSSRAMAGPSRSLASRRSTSSSRALSGSTRPWVTGAAGRPALPSYASRRRRGYGHEVCSRARASSSVASGAPSPTKTCTYPSGSASRSARSNGASAPETSRRPCSAWWARACATRISMRVPAPPALLGGDAEPLEEPVRRTQRRRRTLGRVLGEQDPGQGDVLVLADVGQVVVRGDVRARAPSPGPPTAGPAPRAGVLACAGTGPHVGREVADVDALGLLEQRDGAGQVAFGLAQLGAGDPPAVRVLRQTQVLAQLLGSAQVVGGRPEVVALEGDLAESRRACPAVPRITVSGLVGRRAQRVLEGTSGVAEPSLGDPEVGERDRAAEHVRDVPGPAQPLDGGRVAAVRGLQVSARPGGEAGEGRRGRDWLRSSSVDGAGDGPVGMRRRSPTGRLATSARAAR